MRILGVAAGKGGVGKSTLTAGLALALKRRGKQVGILDADLYGPSLRTLLPEQKPPQKQGDKWIPGVAWGISVMSIAFFKSGALVRAPIANQVISQFLHNVLWGGLDWLLIDFPPGTGDIPLTVSLQAKLTSALLVTTPQELALLDVRQAIRLFDEAKVPICGVVENMSDCDECFSPFGRGGGKRVAEERGVPFLGEIPLDPGLCSAADRGELYSYTGIAEKYFKKIAEKLEV